MGDYTGSKSNNIPFQLEDFAFGCSHLLLAAATTYYDLQYSMFVILKFTTQENGVMGNKIGHKASGGPLP